MPANPRERFDEIEKQIQALIEEQFKLISPTDEEIEEAQLGLEDDFLGDALDYLTSPDTSLGMYFLAEEVLTNREMRAEEEAENAS
jgi:hypothetical protein